MDQKIGLKDEELKRQKWSYWDLWQATPFMTTKQTTTYAANCRLQAYWTGQMNTDGTGFHTCKECHKTESLWNHTTRKENNWKTEEALARAAVTVETERIEGSNPSCLWWLFTAAVSGACNSRLPVFCESSENKAFVALRANFDPSG